MKPNSKLLRPTVQRPQSVRIRDIKPSTQTKINPIQDKAIQKHKLIVQFAVPEKIVKSSNEPFLWESLVLQNTQLKNIITELRNQNTFLSDSILELKDEMKKMIKISNEEFKYADDELHKQKVKAKNVNKSLSVLRLKQSELKQQIQSYEEEKRLNAQQLVVAKNKQNQLGETKMKMYQLLEQNRFLNKKVSDNFREMLERKFPVYHPLIFRFLQVFKRLQKIENNPPQDKFNKLLKFMFGPAKEAIKKLFESVSDWIKYAFFGKVAYHPHNSDLIEAMFQKWRKSNKLAEELDEKSKKLSKMELQYVNMIQTIDKNQDKIKNLLVMNENIAFRNQKLQTTFQTTAYDFAKNLVTKLKKYEQEMKEHPNFQQPQFLNLTALITPQYQKLKQIIELLQQTIEISKNQRVKNQNYVYKNEISKLNSIDNEIEELKDLTQKQKERRSVVILKKNVFGYWIDPNFTHSIKYNKKPYQKYHHKATQTVNEIELKKRIFFSIILLKAKFRSIALKFDPYVKLQYSSNVYKSTVKSGKNPQWNQTYIFQMKQTSMNFAIYDKQKLGRDTLFGEAPADFSKVFLKNSSQQIRMQLQIKDQKGQFVGNLWIGIWMMKQQQVIHIREIEGNFQVQKDILSEMDPYCVFNIDKKIADQTSICRKGGSKPIWRQQFMLYINSGNKQFITSVKDQDLMVDDEIGSGAIEIVDIPSEQQLMVLDLINEDSNVGTLKFKIYKRKYINDSIKQKQPILIKLDIKPERFFIVQQAKIQLLKILPASLFYTIEYSNVLKVSSSIKGKELFYNDPHIFKITQQTQLLIKLYENKLLGDPTQMMNFKYDAAQNITNNYSDTQTVKHSENQAQFSCKYRLLQTVETVFIKSVRIQFQRQINKKLQLEIKINEFTRILELKEQNGALGIQVEEYQELFCHQQFDQVAIKITCGQNQIATGSITKSQIVSQYFTQISLSLNSKSIRIGQAKFIIAKYKYNNCLKQRQKKIILNLQKRQYFSLFAHKAFLKRDTQMIGKMNCYLLMNYLKTYQTKLSKGKQPVWNQSFIFYNKPDKKLEYSVMDKQTIGKDDIVGSGNLDINNILATDQIDNIIGELSYQEQDCGHVFFSIVNIPSQTVVFIEILRAQLHEDTDWFSKIDPYAVISHNNQVTYTTMVLDNKGQNPEWKLSIQVEITDENKPIEIKLFDQDVFSQDYLGIANFQLSKFTSIYEEVSASLLKESKKYGTVYLTAAKGKFINNRALQEDFKSPKMFNSLNLVKFTVIETDTKQPSKFLIKYQYPFEKQTFVETQSAHNQYNYQQYLNVSGTLCLQFHKPHLLKGYQYKYDLKVDLVKQKSFQILQTGILNSKSKLIGSIKCAIEDVYKCQVIYVEKIRLKFIEQKDSRLEFKSSIDKYIINVSKDQTIINEQFWIFSIDNTIELQVNQKSLLSQQTVGVATISLNEIGNEWLSWKNFNIANVGTISIYCAKKLYQKPFNYTCNPINYKSKAEILRFTSYFMEQSKTKSPYYLSDKGNNSKTNLQQETIVFVDEEEEPILCSDFYTLENAFNIKALNQGFVFLQQRKKRVGIITYQKGSLSFLEKSNYFKLIFKDLRIRYNSQQSNVFIKLQEKQDKLTTRIGEYWHCEKLVAYVPENQKCYLEIIKQNKESLTVQLKYEKQCYFENYIHEENLYTIYYSVEASQCEITSKEQPQKQQRQTTELKLFQLNSVSIQVHDRIIGSGFCTLSYGNKTYKYNILNSESICEIPNTSVFEKQQEDSQDYGYIKVDIQCKTKGKSKLSIAKLLKTFYSNEQQIRGQIVSTGVTIGIIKAKFKCLNSFVYRQLRLNNIYVAKEFKNLLLKIQCGGQSISLQPSINQGLIQQTQKIVIFSKDNIFVHAQCDGKTIGSGNILTNSFHLPLKAEQLNIFVKGQILELENVGTYQQNNQKQRMQQNNQLFQFELESIFLQNCQKETIYFSIESQQNTFYSPFYKVSSNNYVECKFSFICFEQKMKIQVWKRQMSTDKMIGEGKIDSMQTKQRTIDFINKSSVTGVGIVKIISNQMAQYQILQKIAASNLRDTQLLVQMKPYLLLKCGKFSLRSNVGVGKQKLTWIINMILPRELFPLELTVMDRDLKYDDEVGSASIKLEGLNQKSEYKLLHKQAESGSVVIHSKIKTSKSNLNKIQNIEKKKITFRCIGLRISKIENLSNKIKSFSLYLKILKNERYHYQYPIIERSDSLLFNRILEYSLESPTEVKIQLCYQNKGQVVHAHANVTLQNTELIRIKMTPATKQTPTIEYQIFPLQQQILNINQVRFFTPDQNPSSKKSFSILTVSEFIKSRQTNSNDNRFGFYDYFYLHSKQQLCFKVFTNQKLIGQSILKNLPVGYHNAKILNEKMQQKGVIQIISNMAQSEGKHIPKIQASQKSWIVMKIYSAKMLRDVQLLSKMDLYCQVEVSGINKKYKTKVLDNIGMLGEWNEQFIIPKLENQIFEIGIWDSEVIKDRIVGSTSLNLSSYSEKQQHSIELLFQKEQAGNVTLSYYYVKNYIRLNNFTNVSNNKIQKITLLSSGKQYQAQKDLSDLQKVVIEVPITQNQIEIQINDKKTLLNIGLLRKKEVFSCIIDKILFFEYRIFVHE